MNNKNKYWIKDFSLESVRNRQETRVVELLRNQIPKHQDFCGCRVCIEDVYALVLNSLPPQYAQAGSLVIRGPQFTETDLIDTVNMAIEKVKAIPNHPAGKSETGT